MNPSDDIASPITRHVRDAAESIRWANHASYADQPEVTDLYDTVGQLSVLLTRLPPLVAHLHRLVNRADASCYDTDCATPTAEILNSTQAALDEAFGKTTTAGNALDDACNALSHLRIHDPDTTNHE